MILQSLVDYYEALAKKGEIPPPGWATVKVSYALEIDENGKLLAILPLKNENLKHPEGRPMWVPERDRNAADITPCFLCDDKRYLLSCPESKSESHIMKAEKAFFETEKRYKEILSSIDCAEAAALLNFFSTWKNQKDIWKDEVEEIGNRENMVFMVNEKFAHQITEIKQAWENYHWNSLQTRRARCMISGEVENICRVHPSFNIPGGTNPKLVSFDKESNSFSSYGKDEQQGLNVPIGNITASKYGLSLKYLLDDDDSCCRLGDMKIVFWAQSGEKAYQKAYSCVMNMNDKTLSSHDLNAIISNISQGKPIAFDNVLLDYENKFYILGLFASSKGRIGVRFFMQNSFGNVLLRFKEHVDRLRITTDYHEKEWEIPLWMVVCETIRYDEKKSIFENMKKVAPKLAGDTLNAILMGTKYPATLYQQVLLRIRAETDQFNEKGQCIKQKINRNKVAIIKAVLIKNYGRDIKEELMSEERSVAYNLGQLFCILESIQRAASPNLNSTIKDKYFNSASTNPCLSFPILNRLENNHIKVVARENPRLANYFENEIARVSNNIGNSYPKSLTLEEQGMFMLGYYQKRYEKKKAENIEEGK